MKKRIITILLAGALAVGTLAGCGSSSDSSSNDSSTASAESTASDSGDGELIDVDFAVDSNGFSGMIPTIAAFSNIDEEFGLNFVLQNISTASDTLAAVQSGKVDVGGFSAPAPLISISEGTDNIEIIGGIMSDYESLIVKPENAEQWKGEMTQELLSGKKIGVNRTNSGDIALRAYLTQQGIDLSEIEYVELDSPASVVEAVNKGSVDAGIVNGSYYTAAESTGLENVRFIKDIIGDDFICCRLLALNENVEENRDLYVNIQKALIKAYELYVTDEDKSVELAQNYIAKDEDEIRFVAYENGDLSLNPDPNLKGIKNYYEGMKSSGYIDSDTDVAIEDYVDTSIYEDALTALAEEEPDNEVLQELQENFAENNQ